jgi:branched-chain amino acid transport system ATP-binding protein
LEHQRELNPEAHSPPLNALSGDPSSFLQVEDLSLLFGGVVALKGVSLTIKQGTISSIVGPNGAGKTTLMNCISRLYRPDSGRISFRGADLLTLRPHQVATLGIARTFQNPELFSRMTTLDNLLLGRHCRIKTDLLGAAVFSPWTVREELRHREQVERVIEFLELQSARHQVVANLPYGTRKLVELGRALAMEPELLLLDEPSAGMSPEEKQVLQSWIEDIRDELGVTVLLVEHDMGLVMRISETVFALNYGEKIAEGPPDVILEHPEVQKAYLGTEDACRSG